MPPGITYAPPASMTVAPEGAEISGPTCSIFPFEQRTSARNSRSAFTTVPPRIRTVLMIDAFASGGLAGRGRELLDDVFGVDELVSQMAGHGRVGHMPFADVQAVAQMNVVACRAFPAFLRN